MEFNKRSQWIKTISDKDVDFVMTIATKITQVINVTIFLIGIYMMNIEFFIRRFANLALFIKISFAVQNITPSFISGSIKIMIFSLQRILTLFRTKFGNYASIWPGFKKVLAKCAPFFNSWFYNAIPRTKSRSFYSIGAWMKWKSTSFTCFNNFRFQSHKEQVYAN